MQRALGTSLYVRESMYASSVLRKGIIVQALMYVMCGCIYLLEPMYTIVVLTVICVRVLMACIL